jgi:hypothetical protein
MSRKTPITVAQGGVQLRMVQAVTHAQIPALYQTETLRTFDGQQGFTLAQGQ